MSDATNLTAPGAGDPGNGGRSKPTPEINVTDLSSLIAAMSRLLSGLAGIGPFKEANLGLAEWVALSVLAEKDGISNRQLARSLGVTGQRANQITTSLTQAGYLSVTQSSEDNRKNEIKITDSGKERFEAVCSQLKPLLSSALKNRERSLVSANRQLKTMMRILQPAAGDKQKKKEARAAKKANEGSTKETTDTTSS